MAYYAFLNDNAIVTEVIAGKDETEILDGVDPETWYSQFRGQRCIRTSYNHRIRGHFAGIGDRYDDTLDLFIAPQPYPSWTMRTDGYWQPPVPAPDEGRYQWDETTQKWVPID
jgi:hypothetical protein